MLSDQADACFSGTLNLSAAADGKSIIFSKPGLMPLTISAGELVEMQWTTSVRQTDGEGGSSK